MQSFRWCLPLVAVACLGCGGGGGPATMDSGQADTAVADTGVTDTGSMMSDTGAADARTDAAMDSGVDTGVPMLPGTRFFNASGGGSLSGGGMRLQVTFGAPVPAGRTSNSGGAVHLGGQSIR